MHKLKRLKLGLSHPHQMMVLEVIVSLVAVTIISTMPVGAVIRFQHRSLLINSTVPGATAAYTLSMEYTSLQPIGSLDMLFCIDPIPYMPCVSPPGLDVSHAVLADQQGETGYHIASQTSNHIVLSRTPTMVTDNVMSSYKFTGIINPTYTEHSFSIRLADYESEDATGPLVDLGSVVNQANDSIEIQTQVPPILLFCLSKQVSDNCTTVEGGNYTDLGPLDTDNTLTAQSQMAVGTNASGGFVVTVNGRTMSSGVNTIPALSTPSPSVPRTNQFGINLVANNAPTVGLPPDGDSTNANPVGDYAIPNRYVFRDGDIIASSPNVSLIRRFTMSYVINTSPTLRAGVYTTTLTYVCSGRF
jgi:hypothetical protein